MNVCVCVSEGIVPQAGSTAVDFSIPRSNASSHLPQAGLPLLLPAPTGLIPKSGCVCVCERARARACVRVRVRACACVRVRVRVRSRDFEACTCVMGVGRVEVSQCVIARERGFQGLARHQQVKHRRL